MTLFGARSFDIQQPFSQCEACCLCCATRASAGMASLLSCARRDLLAQHATE